MDIDLRLLPFDSDTNTIIIHYVNSYGELVKALENILVVLDDRTRFLNANEASALNIAISTLMRIGEHPDRKHPTSEGKRAIAVEFKKLLDDFAKHNNDLNNGDAK